MNKSHYDTLTKHKDLLENYPNIRSIKDQSSAQVTEIAVVHKEYTGKDPNMFCAACLDEIFMDMHHYYNRLKEEAKTNNGSTKEETKINTQQAGKGSSKK